MLVCCLRDPHEYFKLAYGENIDIVNIASNAKQANDVFFTKLRARLKAPCFNQFKPRIGKAIITFPDIGLRLHSLHAANESWEGLNLLAWVMDEASAFQTLGGKDNALNCYSTLSTSASSRFTEKRYIGIIISFPRKQVGDFTLQKYEEAASDPTMYADRASTFDVNPRFDRTHPMYEPEVGDRDNLGHARRAQREDPGLRGEGIHP
jgi:hypothetical protein